jgi:hypothetical protein
LTLFGPQLGILLALGRHPVHEPSAEAREQEADPLQGLLSSYRVAQEIYFWPLAAGKVGSIP